MTSSMTVVPGSFPPAMPMQMKRTSLLPFLAIAALAQSPPKMGPTSADLMTGSDILDSGVYVSFRISYEEGIPVAHPSPGLKPRLAHLTRRRGPWRFTCP